MRRRSAYAEGGDVGPATGPAADDAGPRLGRRTLLGGAGALVASPTLLSACTGDETEAETPSDDTATGEVTLEVNGTSQEVAVAKDTPLLYALRNDLSLKGPRFGCGLSQCGSCTVHLDGEPIRSCVTPVSDAVGKQVTTLEGLGTADDPHPLQEAFIEEQAAQCAYCISGMIMQAAALLENNPRAGDDQIKQEMSGNLCRCGTHMRILRAIKRGQQAMA